MHDDTTHDSLPNVRHDDGPAPEWGSNGATSADPATDPGIERPIAWTRLAEDLIQYQTQPTEERGEVL